MKLIKIKDKYYMTKVNDAISFPSSLDIEIDSLKDVIDALEEEVKNGKSSKVLDSLYSLAQRRLDYFNNAALEVEMANKTFVPYVKNQKQRLEKLKKQIENKL